jgi:hypothetical protein
MADTSSWAAPTEQPPRAKNGYYYWHGHEKERKELGDVAPMPTHVPLATTDLAVTSPVEQTFSELHKYSWCNNTKTVSVYVELPEPNASNTTVVFEAATLSVQFRPSPSEVKQLKISLAKEVNPEGCSFRFKPDQVVIKLAKAKDDETWWDLVSKA